MEATPPEDDVREELERVEAQVARLRRETAELHRRRAERWDEPGDWGDRATLTTVAEELEAIIATLEARRDRLRALLRDA